MCPAMCSNCQPSGSDMGKLYNHEFCVIGAGPGGLQLGHLLLSAGRDYVIFEREARAGTFFDQ
jgi:cation diffusion facilitator CzcD-associated flavoprotein CzcO